jgi:hypothetical protein
MDIAHPVNKLVVSAAELFIDSLKYLILAGEAAGGVCTDSKRTLLWTRRIVIS